METWADTLNDKLSADQVKIRNSVQQDQFGIYKYSWSTKIK